jgi:hypothetical protein
MPAIPNGAPSFMTIAYGCLPPFAAHLSRELAPDASSQILMSTMTF